MALKVHATCLGNKQIFLTLQTCRDCCNKCLFLPLVNRSQGSQQTPDNANPAWNIEFYAVARVQKLVGCQIIKHYPLINHRVSLILLRKRLWGVVLQSPFQIFADCARSVSRNVISAVHKCNKYCHGIFYMQQLAVRNERGQVLHLRPPWPPFFPQLHKIIIIHIGRDTSPHTIYTFYQPSYKANSLRTLEHCPIPVS